MNKSKDDLRFKLLMRVKQIRVKMRLLDPHILNTKTPMIRLSVNTGFS
jgi:hypothetical protein